MEPLPQLPLALRPLLRLRAALLKVPAVRSSAAYGSQQKENDSYCSLDFIFLRTVSHHLFAQFNLTCATVGPSQGGNPRGQGTNPGDNPGDNPRGDNPLAPILATRATQ